MTDYKEKLIDMYANTSVENLANNNDFIKLCKQNEDDWDFLKFRRKIAIFKERLDRIIGNRSPRVQVNAALHYLRKKVAHSKKPLKKSDLNKDEYNDFNSCKKYIFKAYSKNWNTEQKTYFTENAEKILTYFDYFLSFTRRNPSQGQPNSINIHYMPFIAKYLRDSDVKNEKKLVGENLLAKALNRILTDFDLFGFFFPDHEGNNEKVIEKLEYASMHSFIFIQLLQPIMFKKREDDRENYCFIEYNLVKGNDDNRILFVLADRSREKFLDCSCWYEYDEWFEHIEQKDIVVLTPAKDLNDIEVFERKIEKNIRDKILGFRDKLFDKVPD